VALAEQGPRRRGDLAVLAGQRTVSCREGVHRRRSDGERAHRLQVPDAQAVVAGGESCRGTGGTPGPTERRAE
jgi:hypothetical protein